MKVVIVSSARWALFRLSKQEIARALAADGHDVLYVDPPVSAASVIVDRTRWRDLLGARDETPDPHLKVWHPVVVPGQNSSIGQRINGSLLARGIANRMPAPDLAIAFSLEARGLMPRLDGRRVYYCTDSAADLPGVDAKAVAAQERELIGTCDAVVACSLPLCEQLRALGCDPVYLPHAVDQESFLDPGPAPDDISSLPRPLVGYVGSLNFRIDHRLLDAARRAAADGTLVIVGSGFGPSASPAAKRILDAKGVEVLGNRPSDLVASYMAAFDVGVVPYTTTPFNRKSFPLKILQYLAAGVPVVSSSNGATDELGEAVHVADNPDAFVASVRCALGESSAAERAARREIARRRTWRDNARALVALCR